MVAYHNTFHYRISCFSKKNIYIDTSIMGVSVEIQKGLYIIECKVIATVWL